MMAEFQEVMRQWGRLCTQHCAENDDDCDGCLLGGTRADVCGSYAKDNFENVKELERLVMEWAAEHPEPVYPTWLEWLKSMGVIPYMMSMVVGRDDEGNFIHGHVDIKENALKPIPADIAQKLGLEPKDG